MTTSLVLRVCDANMTSHSDFQWPGVGEVAEAKDWQPTPECGAGLHGWLHGGGDHTCTNYHESADAKWLVVEVETASIVQLGGKVKFQRGTVRFVGSRKDATDYLLANEPRAIGVAIIGAQRQVGDDESVMVGALGFATAGYGGTATAGAYGTATAGYGGTATAGNSGTATAGAYGTATAGNSGTATAGNYGTATAGNSGTATAGDRGTATAGNYGTATAGYGGTATAGAYGTATAGYSGTATAGNSGTATAGAYGTATAGYGGTATAGELGELRIRWWDYKHQRYRTEIAYVGENGIEPNVAYKLDAEHRFVRVKP